MEKKWYIVQIIAGYEERVKTEILRRIQERGLQEQFGDILIPEAKTQKNYFASSQIDDSSIEQLFPGYIVVSLVPDVSNFRIVKTVNRVIRFLGGESPLPLSQEEVDRILLQISGKVVVASAESIVYQIGETIEIAGGPFCGFSGVINSIDEQKQKLVVMISIFNRLTPIEILFSHIKK
jgi:transcriptional antiterminator NusG